MGAAKTFRALETYVVLDQPARAVAGKLDVSLNSVYRAREPVTRMLQEKLVALGDED